jgi:hypothetical protein
MGDRLTRIDPMSAKGAQLLAARIERYWRKRGYNVQTRIVHEGEISNSSVYGVRTNLVNGHPHEQTKVQSKIVGSLSVRKPFQTQARAPCFASPCINCHSIMI